MELCIVMIGVRGFFFRKNKIFENFFRLGKKYRLKNLIRWSFYLEIICFFVNIEFFWKVVKNGFV